MTTRNKIGIGMIVTPPLGLVLGALMLGNQETRLTTVALLTP